MKYLFILSFFLTQFSYSETNESYFFQKGLSASEKLIHFLESHPCETGIKKDCERPFKAKDLAVLKSLFLELDEWRKIAFDRVAPMAALKFDKEVDVKRGSRFRIERADKVIVTIGEDEASMEFVNDVIISTANNLFLYESFFKLTDVIGKARKLKTILERDLPGEAPVLVSTYQLVMDEKLWAKTKYSVVFLEKLKAIKISIPQVSGNEIFSQFISHSSIYQTMKSSDLDFRLKKILFLAGQISSGKFFDHLYTVVGFISKLFGNTAGMFQSRDGKLKVLASNSHTMKKMKERLKPLSILLEKTPFRLTDQFIPGYFGHVAIWVGSPLEIARYQVKYQNKIISLIDHPVVKPHLSKLNEGKLVLEALRLPGVTLNTLENFMDIDDLVIMDPPSMNDEEVAQHLLRAFSQVDKPYDFNFNVESEIEIVCSELIYAVFTNEDWPTSISMGRFTISPDHVARKASGTFTPKVMYLDGKEVKENLDQELMRVLEPFSL